MCQPDKKRPLVGNVLFQGLLQNHKHAYSERQDRPESASLYERERVEDGSAPQDLSFYRFGGCAAAPVRAAVAGRVALLVVALALWG